MQNMLSKARWQRIAPVLFITYSFAYLDRVNFSFASVGGLARDLHVDSSTASLIGALFFLGYFSAQIPGAVYAQRRSPKKIVFLCLILWGIFSALTGVVSNIPALLVVRFMLGVVEAAVFPALVIFINRWFARSERSFATSFVVLSTPVTVLWMSIVSGYLVKAFGWRMMFVLEGVPASLWGLGWWFLVQDRPAQATWLAPEESAAIEAKIASEQDVIKPMRNYAEAFRSAVVLRLTTLYFFWGLSLYGFILWLPTIIKESGTSDTVTLGWLSAGPYLCTAILMPFISRVSDRMHDRRHLVWSLLAMSAVSFFLLFMFPAMPFWPAYVLLSLVGIGLIAGIAPFFSIPADVLPQNVAGGAIGLINSLGALGGFVGTYLVGWMNGMTGDPHMTFLLMGASLVVSVVLLWFPMNRK